ncbi:MAG: glycosyltransferase family 1 protein [Burkholderiaceae bacterium]
MTLRHVGLSFGRVEHWHDGLGEFSRQLALALAARAPALLAERGVRLHYHLPRQWHGLFGTEVNYLGTHTSQRLLHLRRERFALWHCLHQHIRLRPPLGTERVMDTVHDLNFLHTKRGAKLERYRSRLRRRLQGRDQIVAISHHAARDIERELAPLPAPIQVIPNGVTDLSHAPREPIGELAGAAPFLLHISRMAPSKNVAALVELAAAWPQQRFVFAGGASGYSAEVQREISARGLHNVSLHFDVSEAQKAWLYAQCLGFVFPSFTEGFGLPPLEAMCFGKPVFLSRLTSLPEIGGDAAWYFDDFAPAAMRRVVEAGLATHEHEQRAAQVAAHARRFDWTRCAARYEAVYLRLLGDVRKDD